jgi:outer membrane immunogenic protein
MRGFNIRGAFFIVIFSLAGGMASAQESGVDRWSGFYVGLNAGGGWLNDVGIAQCYNPQGSLNGTGCAQRHSIGQVTGGGFVGGAQTGVNYGFMAGGVPLVMGAEIDMQGSTIGGNSIAPEGLGTFYGQQNIDWMATARARLGVASLGNTLIYGTFGVMLAQIDEVFDRQPGAATFFRGSARSLRLGPTVGGGIEYLVSKSFSVKAEMLYYDLGVDTFFAGSTPGTGFVVGKDFYTQGEIIRVGFNFRL